MKIINERVEHYVEQYTSPESKLMKSLNRDTYLKTFYPTMLSGQVQGKFLEMVSRMIKPERILEIGTFTGYSAIAMAGGLTSDGKLITIEVNEELEDFITDYFKKSGHSDKIELLIGDALEIVPKLKDSFDLVFIDADKEQYIDYYEAVIPLLKKGGFILADNVIWSGKVLEDDTKSDKETMGIKAFNVHIKNDDRVEQVMLSIRDGLMLIRKV